MSALVLVILLHDRSVDKVEVEGAKRHKLGIGSKKRIGVPKVREITLYVPRRIYSEGSKGGTHASPRAHYRAEHTRMQPYGPRGSGQYREITIAAMWVNAEPDEFTGTRIKPRSYKLVANKEAA